ncbi:nuclear-pore anchor isoform X1 [Helianthus annuus]|uniref:nuclear-pore anchor isoform X1 n=2 Tax=Helianthus annuus TaxID=4232 RepID=UPI000B8FEC79|nr:nuclear-pore anchor isoform X1 [Helianthus annuus]KAJ0552350.1 putative nucleoprotein TPR/MLP1 [Helianthus annuus]
MPLFLSDEEYARCNHDPSLITQKADAYIRELHNQLDTEKSQHDAASVTAEQTCSLLEHKYVSLKSEFDTLQAQCSQLSSSLEERVSEVAQIQADKHQIYLQSIGKDGEIERLSLETSELQKSKSQLLQLIEHKDLEINEKNSSIKGYLDKIVSMTDSASSKDSRIIELEAEHARMNASSARLTQEKELVERHNLWLNDELTTKVNSLLELRKVHNELEADMSSKLAELERKYNETSSSLKWKDDRVNELESKLEALQAEICSSKEMAAATEERLSTELSTVNKLVELYKENSDEWSKKSGELEGVIKALETHASQLEKDYKERLSNETSARIQFETEVSLLKEKFQQCEKELETYRNSDHNLLQLSSFNTKAYEDNNNNNNPMLVPSVPAGISGTALAASLLRDGWSLVKMYEKYQEAVDALRHEEFGRKHSQSVLERVLHEIEEKAEVILDERVEHERMLEAYTTLNEKLQHSLSEQTVLEKTAQELKAEVKKHKRDYGLAQKENNDLQKQVTVLLKECRDVQMRCGSVNNDSVEVQMDVNLDSDDGFSDRMLTFKDINGLVEQNVQLRGVVRLLTEQIETKEVELKENFEKEFQKQCKETASKVDAVLARAEEQTQMIDSLHTSVAMYKKLYEEEHKRHVPQLQSSDPAPVDVRNIVRQSEAFYDSSSKKAKEKAYERIKLLEEEITGIRSEIITLRSERDKLTSESTFANEKLDRFMKDFDRQREEMNGVIARNVEFSQLIVDYQRKIREASESLHIAEDLSRKLNMEVSVLKREKEILINSEKRAFEEVGSMSERVHQLQTTLNTIQSAEEVREESRNAQRLSQEDYVKRTERDWAEAKNELQKERDNIRKLTLEHESAMRGSMQRIEEMGKELANALHAVSVANTRASAAEERVSQFEKTKSSETNIENDDTSKGDVAVLKEEIEKLKAEAKPDKDHMLQYKRLAQVNESALREMEFRHERFKSEAEKVKKSLEDEVLSLKEQVNQLQDGYISKEKEAASAVLSQEHALASSTSEVFKLREEITAKTLRVDGLESRISAMKDELEKEHQRWRIAQDNYERQVILQSETIQELTKTSQELTLINEKLSELQKVSDILKTENDELKTKWETEKSVLEESKDKAEKKFNEVNEQNKILHDQLEALHIKLAGSVAQTSDDGGLQNVVKYLRRSKEIAETEISLLKQERLRLQSQLEAAMKAESEAQALLRTERDNSRSVHFTEDEFKALQVQVREMNLLRESNVQLREENRHNFEECQKLRQLFQDAKIEVENLNGLIVERQNEVEGFKREIEMQKKNMKDREDYVRLQVDFQQINVKLSEKDGQLEEIKKRVSEKQDVIIRLERDLERSKVELDVRESKINNVVQTESLLKTEVDKQKRLIYQLKRRCENLAKEKEETLKKNQELSDELVKRSNVDGVGELAEKDTRIQMLEKTVEKLRDESREKEEKDTRIQMLEKIVERLRDDVKKGKEEVRIEKAKNQNTDNGIREEPKVEPRKLARKLIRPSIVKPEQPKGDADMSDAIDTNVQSSLRKRPSTAEAPEESNDVSVADVAPPQAKKSRGSEQAHEVGDVCETVTEELFNPGDETQIMKEDDNTVSDYISEENATKTEIEASEDQHKITEVAHTQLQPVTSDPEEGDFENQVRSPPPMPVEDEMPEETLAETEVSSALLTTEDDEDKHGEESEVEVEETTLENSTDKFDNDSVGNQDSSAVSGVSTSTGPTEVKPEEPVTGLRITSLNERARQRSLQRLSGAQFSPPVTRGRGRVIRGRTRGGRTARGGGRTPGSQGM